MLAAAPAAKPAATPHPTPPLLLSHPNPQPPPSRAGCRPRAHAAAKLDGRDRQPSPSRKTGPLGSRRAAPPAAARRRNAQPVRQLTNAARPRPPTGGREPPPHALERYRQHVAADRAARGSLASTPESGRRRRLSRRGSGSTASRAASDRCPPGQRHDEVRVTPRRRAAGRSPLSCRRRTLNGRRSGRGAVSRSASGYPASSRPAQSAGRRRSSAAEPRIGSHLAHAAPSAASCWPSLRTSPAPLAHHHSPSRTIARASGGRLAPWVT